MGKAVASFAFETGIKFVGRGLWVTLTKKSETYVSESK